MSKSRSRSRRHDSRSRVHSSKRPYKDISSYTLRIFPVRNSEVDKMLHFCKRYGDASIVNHQDNISLDISFSHHKDLEDAKDGITRKYRSEDNTTIAATEIPNKDKSSNHKYSRSRSRSRNRDSYRNRTSQHSTPKNERKQSVTQNYKSPQRRSYSRSRSNSQSDEAIPDL